MTVGRADRVSRASQALRIIYADLVRRRSTVRIVPAQEDRHGEPPIFVLGLYRSGTTLLRYVLDSHPRIAVPPESDFLQVLALLTDEPARSGLKDMGFDEEHVLQQAAAFGQYFFSNYAAAKRKPRWGDKSPLYVDHIDLLASLYPQARFIVIYRHPLDQIHSLTKGGSFEHSVIETHFSSRTESEDVRIRAARYWASRTELLRGMAGRDNTFALRYEDMCEAPDLILRQVFAHIGESWDPAVLEFYRGDHDAGKEAVRTKATRGFERASGRFRQWPDDVAEKAWEICRSVAVPLGYKRDGV